MALDETDETEDSESSDDLDDDVTPPESEGTPYFWPPWPWPPWGDDGDKDGEKNKTERAKEAAKSVIDFEKRVADASLDLWVWLASIQVDDANGVFAARTYIWIHLAHTTQHLSTHLPTLSLKSISQRTYPHSHLEPSLRR